MQKAYDCGRKVFQPTFWKEEIIHHFL